MTLTTLALLPLLALACGDKNGDSGSSGGTTDGGTTDGGTTDGGTTDGGTTDGGAGDGGTADGGTTDGGTGDGGMGDGGGPDGGAGDGGGDGGGESPTVVLNELMSNNVSVYADAAGEYEDWVEIANVGTRNIDLSGWTLSLGGKGGAWTFPADTTLHKADHLVVFLDGDTDKTELHATLDLDPRGAILTLLDPGRAEADAVRIPELGADEVYGRDPDGRGGWTVLTTATPGDVNAGR